MTTVHSDRSPLAGQTVKIKEGTLDPAQNLVVGGAMYWVEDWWDHLTGKTWSESVGNFAAVHYGFRLGVNGLPADNEVVYGKIGSLGHIVHVSEIEGYEQEPIRATATVDTQVEAIEAA